MMTEAEVTAELSYRLRQQELAAAFGSFALKTHDVPALLQEATRVCAEGMRCGFCKVMEYLPAEAEFVIRAGVGWRPGIVGRARTGAGTDSPAGYAFWSGQPVISNDLESSDHFRTPPILQEHGVKRAINVPIQGDHGRFGILEVDSSGDGRFTEADLDFLRGFASLLGVAIDRQNAEEALRAREEELAISLGRQELLTREISHRVKNSLSIVAGLLDLQSRHARDLDLRRGLSDARLRVQAIANLHDHLWRAEDVEAVDIAEFLRELCQQLQQSSPELTLVFSAGPATVETELAISLGLLTNELVTNAFKYAYPNGGSGEVAVTLSGTSPGELRLEVVDRGVGLPAEADRRSGGLGMKLIQTLSSQVGGNAVWSDAAPGTRFALTFSTGSAAAGV